LLGIATGGRIYMVFEQNECLRTERGSVRVSIDRSAFTSHCPEIPRHG
jgi:hypothetical protein